MKGYGGLVCGAIILAPVVIASRYFTGDWMILKVFAGMAAVAAWCGLAIYAGMKIDGKL